MKRKLSSACSSLAGDRNHTDEAKHAIVFVPPRPSLSLPIFFFVRPFGAPSSSHQTGLKDGESGKNAVAHPIPCGNFSLRVFPIRPRRMAISPNEAFSRVVVVSQLYRVTLSRRDIENRSVARKFAGFMRLDRR